jgi:hypothetical protein
MRPQSRRHPRRQEKALPENGNQFIGKSDTVADAIAYFPPGTMRVRLLQGVAVLPAKVMVMRHAEKRDDPDDPNLSDAGVARASALISWYPVTFGRPEFIIATAASRHSQRPVQTVEPLALSLGIPIDTTFADQDYGALAKSVLSDSKYAEKSILICWHHGNIPGLLRGLGIPDGAFPDPWDPRVFNLIIEADYASETAPSVKQTFEPF